MSRSLGDLVSRQGLLHLPQPCHAVQFCRSCKSIMTAATRVDSVMSWSPSSHAYCSQQDGTQRQCRTCFQNNHRRITQWTYGNLMPIIKYLSIHKVEITLNLFWLILKVDSLIRSNNRIPEYWICYSEFSTIRTPLTTAPPRATKLGSWIHCRTEAHQFSGSFYLNGAKSTFNFTLAILTSIG